MPFWGKLKFPYTSLVEYTRRRPEIYTIAADTQQETSGASPQVFPTHTPSKTRTCMNQTVGWTRDIGKRSRIFPVIHCSTTTTIYPNSIQGKGITFHTQLPEI